MPEIEFRVGGKSQTVPAEDRQTILDCALIQAVDAPYSCLEGVCGSCKALIRDGEVEVPPETELEKAEHAQGFVLTCQARIKHGCARLVVDYDAAST